VFTKILFAAVASLTCAPIAGAAEPPEVRSILDQFRAVRPQPEHLALYDLDWAPTLRAAKERGAKEARPIFLIVVTNSFGNISSGHC
jgi:hypothetical protein